jgi:N-acyl-D-amino-acid deacylase
VTDSYDIVLRGGRVLDGTGAPAIQADVALVGDRVAAIGKIAPRAGRHEIDARGKVVAPGFIDVHTHDDRACLASDQTPKVSQGVTTVVVGNCGVSLAPLVPDRLPPPLDLLGDAADYKYPRFADYMAELDRSRPAVNAACLVGHSTLRVGAMAELQRPATEVELGKMRERLAEALEAGAVGMSTGLFYAPANPAPAAEVTALAALLAPAGAVYTTHMRDEGDHVMDSLDETFSTAKAAGVAVVVSHHKTVGKNNFGRTSETLPRIAKAIAEQPVGLDAYPYIASSTVLRPQMIPISLKILVTWSKSHPDMAGRELTAIAKDWGVSQEEAADRLQPAGAIYWTMDEGDVRRVLAFDQTMIGSDGLPHDHHPHPRLWGTFPRVLGHYCREEKLFPLEKAVHKMTGLSAARFGLSNRGVLKDGAYADIVMFDAERVIDRATFEAPKTPAAGIDLVVVNGQIVWQEGVHTGARPGRALRRQEMQNEARR